MNKPETGKTGRRTDAPPPKAEKSLAGRVLADAAPKRKPSGPVIYRIEKGADVWPGRR